MTSRDETIASELWNADQQPVRTVLSVTARSLVTLFRCDGDVSSEISTGLALNSNCLVLNLLQCFVRVFSGVVLSQDIKQLRSALNNTSCERKYAKHTRLMSEALLALMDLHNADQAIFLLDQSIVANPRNVLGYRMLYDLLILNGQSAQIQETFSAYNQYLSDTVFHPFLQGMWAYGLCECGDFELSHAAAYRVLHVTYDDDECSEYRSKQKGMFIINPWALHTMAHALMNMARMEDAITLLEEKLDITTPADKPLIVLNNPNNGVTNGFEPTAEPTSAPLHFRVHEIFSLCALDRYVDALESYDTYFAPHVAHTPLGCRLNVFVLCDATASLWKLHSGDRDSSKRNNNNNTNNSKARVDYSRRWRDLAQHWSRDRVTSFTPYFDFHRVLALAGAGLDDVLSVQYTVPRDIVAAPIDRSDVCSLLAHGLVSYAAACKASVQQEQLANGAKESGKKEVDGLLKEAFDACLRMRRQISQVGGCRRRATRLVDCAMRMVAVKSQNENWISYCDSMNSS